MAIDSQSIKHNDAVNDEGLKAIYQQLSAHGNSQNHEWITPVPEDGIKKYAALFTPIAAAGGVVFNKQGKLLWIFRLGKWDLPKGKLEQGETIPECALREVAEECGLALSELHLVQPLPNSYHTYEQKGTPILKTTYWFEMLYSGEGLGTPQTIEDIQQVDWLDKSTSESRAMAATYANIRAIFSGIKWL